MGSWYDLTRVSEGNSWLPIWLIDRLGRDYLDTVTVVQLSPDIVHRDPFFHGPFDHRDFNPILAQVALLSQLEWLDLSFSSVTDADLAHLRQLSNLRRLVLRGTDVTDFGLAYLKSLTLLESLDLRGTKVTDAGESELEQSLPSLSVIR